MGPSSVAANEGGAPSIDDQHHIVQTLFALSDLMRGHLRDPGQLNFPAALLLENAVRTTLGSTGIHESELYPWREPFVDLPPRSAAEVATLLAQEADWLLRNQQVWTFYGNELMRAADSGFARGESTSARGAEGLVLTVCDGLGMHDRDSLSILDVACGRGTLLSALASHYEQKPALLAGQDINDEALGLASRNLAIAGHAAILRRGDLLTEDAFPDFAFDLVVLDGPLGMQTPERSGYSRDPRYPQDLPPVRGADWWMVMMALAKVKAPDDGGGSVIAFMRPGALWSRDTGSNAIRTWIQNQDLLQAIVALPERLTSRATGIPVYALVLSNVKPNAFGGKAQVIDLRGSFEIEPGRRSTRRITEQGLAELRDALCRAKPSALVRTCPLSSFEYRNWRVEVEDVSAIVAGRPRNTAKFSRYQPASAQDPGWPRPGTVTDRQIRSESELGSEVLWDIDRIFGSRTGAEATKTLNNLGWETSPLLLRARHLEYRRSESSRTDAERSDGGVSPWTSDSEVLVMPLTESDPVVFGRLEDVITERRAVIVELHDRQEGEFLAAWFASGSGAVALKAAREKVFGQHLAPRVVNADMAFGLLADLIVPVPGHEEQSRLLDAHQLLEAAVTRARELTSELWQSPQRAGDIAKTARVWSDGGDLATWADTLPYPMAISLRTVQAFDHDDEKAARQLVHFWEATATFLATYLLSAVRAADDLWASEAPQLRTAIESAGLTFDRASLGTWRITIERLAKLFRQRRSGDDQDERIRALQLLGNPPSVLMDRVLSQELVKLLGRLNETRNVLDGHPGTLTAVQARSVRERFTALTEELRSLIGLGWTDFPLVRSKGMEFDGSMFAVSAEVLVGPTVPFLTRKLQAPRPLQSGRLYLVGDGGMVDLAPFIQLGRAPDDPETTCWFYNRREKDGVRLVAYQAAESSDVTRRDDQVEALLQDLGNRQRPNFPDLEEFEMREQE
jgi:SAM-dependent methyltransferase